MLDKELKQYATDRQWNIIKSVDRNGGIKEASIKLQIPLKTVQNAIKSVNRKAALKGYAPDSDLVHYIPEGFEIKGVSDMRTNSDGKPQWVKYDKTKQQQKEAFDTYVAHACEGIKPLKPVRAPKIVDKDYLSHYTITDYHYGMLAWGKETGNDWDCGIAAQLLMDTFGHMVNSSRDTETAIIHQGGDFYHQDGIKAETPMSGHAVDTDGRFEKIADSSLDLLTGIVELALQKHKKVHVVMAEGNHDMSSSIWLRVMFRRLYANEPRVTIDDSVLPYYAYQFYNNMIGFHHGHMKKMEALPLFFAANYSEMWGATNNRYIHTGHLHNQHDKEFSGVTVYQHPTIAARDSYCARGGWISKRQARAMTYHKKRGLADVNYVTPELFEEEV